MGTVGNDLDWCQSFLRDQGTIWPRSELLDYYQEAYRQLVAAKDAVRQYTVLDVPPHWSWSGTQRWEQLYADNGTFNLWAVEAGRGTGVSSHNLSGLQDLVGVQETSSSEGITQPWEMSFVHPIFQPFRFALSRPHTRIVKVWYDHRLLFPVSVRELDWTWTNWPAIGNYPLAWTTGTGNARTYEIYEVQVVPGNVYQYVNEQPRYPTGMVRAFIPGARTYVVDEDDRLPSMVAAAYTHGGDAHAVLNRAALFPYAATMITQDRVRATVSSLLNVTAAYCTQRWEWQWLQGLTRTASPSPTLCFPWEAPYVKTIFQQAVGVIRGIDSPDRQYWPVVNALDQRPLGKIEEVKSSQGSLLFLEVIEPEVVLLQESDTPGMLPPPVQKYVRYATLARAFNRQGEGYNPAMAGVCEQLGARGAMLLQRLSFLVHKDITWARKPVTARTRPPRPRLPSGYPSVWR